MSKRRNRVGRNMLEYSKVENFYVSQLLNIYCIAYEWKGLPDSIDPRWLEMNLIKKGKVLFYKELEEIGLVVFPTQAANRLNSRGYPITWRTFGANGYTAEVPLADSEYCYNNYAAYPDLQAVFMFAKRLTYADVSIDGNILMQRFPGLIRGSETQRLTMENLVQDYVAGTPLIMADKDLDMSNFEHLDFKVPYVADKLEYTKRDILADALNYIGIQYSSSNKKERLAATEIDSNIGHCEANRMAHLVPRQECAERMNKRWGLNVSVNIRDGLVNMLKIADINPNANVQDKTLYGSSSGEKEGVSL